MQRHSARIDLSSTDLVQEVEVFPGIHERRWFLRSSFATAASLLMLRAMPQKILAQATLKGAGPMGADKLSWDDFLKQSIPVAQQLITDPGFSVDEYLYRIGSLATRLKEIPDTVLGPYTAVDRRVWFGPSFRGSPFYIIQWRMEPGAVLPPHNHPNASVCTLGYQGEVRVRNFEIIGEAPDYSSATTFRVRETRSEMMSQGRINTLSPSRDNIHCFQVGKEGARGIDINTLHGKTAPFRFLDIGNRPEDSEKSIFEAAWSTVGQSPPAGKS